MRDIEAVRRALRHRIVRDELIKKRAQAEVVRELLELAKVHAVEAVSAHSYSVLGLTPPSDSYSVLGLATLSDSRFAEGEAHAWRNCAQLLQCKLDALEAEVRRG